MTSNSDCQDKTTDSELAANIELYGPGIGRSGLVISVIQPDKPCQTISPIHHIELSEPSGEKVVVDGVTMYRWISSDVQKIMDETGLSLEDEIYYETRDVSAPDELEGMEIDGKTYKYISDDVDLVISQTGASREEAIIALNEQKGDIVNTIMSLTF